MAARIVPTIAGIATLLGAVVWSNAALLVGLGVVALAGSVGPFAAEARDRLSSAPRHAAIRLP
jgi:hypothetical protein